MNLDMSSEMAESMLDCIDDCQTCHNVCTQTIQHCLEMGGEHAEVGHIRLMQDCAQICQTSADFMLRNSVLHTLTCGVCAEVCERCAVDCSRYTGDEMMQECAEVCRNCAESCREMASLA